MVLFVFVFQSKITIKITVIKYIMILEKQIQNNKFKVTNYFQKNEFSQNLILEIVKRD